MGHASRHSWVLGGPALRMDDPAPQMKGPSTGLPAAPRPRRRVTEWGGGSKSSGLDPAGTAPPARKDYFSPDGNFGPLACPGSQMPAKHGRPEIVPTDAQRLQVEELAACGMKHIGIAAVIGCSEPALRKHFAIELADGPARRRAEILQLLYTAARKGNVSAGKHLELMTHRIAAENAFTGAEAQPESKPEKLGKKEQAQRAAEVAGQGSEWGSDLAFRGRAPN